MKNLIILLTLFLLSSCAGNNEEVLANMDKVYGCDNPHRQLTDIEYNICIDKQRATGEPIEFDKLSTNFRDLLNFEGRGGGGGGYAITVNKPLWDSALKITKQYPLKIADNQGGYIETDWIYSIENLNQRCAIKISILSTELVSNAVETNFLCQKEVDEIWIADGNDYTNEEKQLTLKILNEASKISQLSNL